MFLRKIEGFHYIAILKMRKVLNVYASKKFQICGAKFTASENVRTKN